MILNSIALLCTPVLIALVYWKTVVTDATVCDAFNATDAFNVTEAFGAVKVCRTQCATAWQTALSISLINLMIQNLDEPASYLFVCITVGLWKLARNIPPATSRPKKGA